MNKVEGAKLLAQKWHKGQKYGETYTYLYHLTDVHHSVMDGWYCGAFDIDPDVVSVVAYLHDILEDTLCEESTIEEMFGSEVLAYVKALTKQKGEYLTDYIARVKQHKVSLIVKIHDTMCNLRQSVFDGNDKRILKYSKQLQLLVE